MKLSFRSYDPQQDACFFKQMYHNPDVMQFIPNAHRFLEDDGVQALLKHPSLLAFYVIEDLEGAQLIGQGCIFEYLDKSHCCELGYIIDQPYWNKGVGKQTIDFLMQEAFQYFKAQQVYCRLYADNVGSEKLCEYAQMQLVQTRELEKHLTELTYMRQGVV